MVLWRYAQKTRGIKGPKALCGSRDWNSVAVGERNARWAFLRVEIPRREALAFFYAAVIVTCTSAGFAV